MQKVEWTLRSLTCCCFTWLSLILLPCHGFHQAESSFPSYRSGFITMRDILGPIWKCGKNTGEGWGTTFPGRVDGGNMSGLSDLLPSFRNQLIWGFFSFLENDSRAACIRLICWRYPSKHETLIKCCVDVGPPSSTPSQHPDNTGSTSRDCWDSGRDGAVPVCCYVGGRWRTYGIQTIPVCVDQHTCYSRMTDIKENITKCCSIALAMRSHHPRCQSHWNTCIMSTL